MRILLLLILTSRILYSQQNIIALERNDTLPVFNLNDEKLAMPFTGGFNYISAGSIDLDLDGEKDLVLFDRTGDRTIPLVWTGSEDNEGYRFDHKYVDLLPDASFFMVFRDFNCDDKEDVFAFRDGGIEVYKNISSASEGLKFELYTESLLSFYDPGTLPVYTIPIDIPVFEDMDNDGDLDVMAFGLLGACVEYHRNMAKENLDRCDTLMLKLESDNWGNFTENLSTNEVNFNDSCDITGGRINTTARHAGSSMTAFDADGDGDKELLLGDIAYRTLVLLTNGGSSTSALITEQQSPWPQNTTFVNLSIFPAASFVDVDHDGKRDMLVSPNSEGGSENFRCIWYYKNNGTDEAPVFEFIQTSAFVENTLDFGEGAMPTFCDYNQDGLADIVVGNYGYYLPSGTYRPQLALLENTGSAGNPEYTLVDNDFAGLGTLSGNSLNFHPTFGDIDGDGDEDMLVGTSDGRIFHYVNTALPGEVANYLFVTADFQGIDIGTFAAPQLADVDNDGLLDLLIGSRNGKIHYYHNDGILQNMVLNLVTDELGGISTVLPGEPSGFSTPCFFKKQGVSYMLCGSQNGRFYIYSGIDGNLDGQFILEDSLFLGNRDGERTSIAVRELTGDAYPEAITGNYAGGLNYYQGIFASSLSSKMEISTDLQIIPNPGRNIQLHSRNEFMESFEVFDASGRLLQRHSPGKGFTLYSLNGSDFKSGIYFIKVKTASKTEVLKWVNQ
ncbi:MAG: T9SS type A sorting domain-containing protein [Bacteroidia bacterium]